MDAKNFYKQTATNIAAYLMQELNIIPGTHWMIRNATSGPRVLTLAININPKYAGKIATMEEALSMAAMLDRSQSIRVSRGNRGTLAIEVPKPESLWFNIGMGNLPRRRGLTATIGLDGDHRPALVDFANPMSPHVLLAGATGSGKTNALKLLAHNLVSQNGPEAVELVLIDTRKRGANWRDFEHVPHLGHPIITDDETALRALGWACAEIDRRATSGGTKPHLFVGIDELQALLDKDICPVADEIGALLEDYTATGREFNCHAIFGIQNPTAGMMGGKADLKRNVVTRLVGKVDSATAAVVCTGQAETGAERLTGAGDFLLIEPMGVKRLTAALLTEKDVSTLPRTESVRSLDLSQYEDTDHVLAQADNGRSKADDLDPKQVAIALIAERGITWLTQRLSIGSAKARRVLEFANELRDELIAMGAYTTIPPYQKGIPGERNDTKRLYPGMVVCPGEE